MLSKKISTLINEQIKKELDSAYLYLEVADFYESNGLKGFANWFKVQAKEEQDHAEIFYNFLHSMNEPVMFYKIEPSGKIFSTLLEPLEEALEHEQFISASINNIVSEANEENEYAALTMLEWFVKEQMEEEENAQELIDSMKLFGDSCGGLYALDKDLSCREYKPAVMD